jgi:hypothetical protein
VSPANHRGPRCRLAALFVVVCLLRASGLWAQNDPIERTFTEPRVEVEKAVTAAKTSSSGKLPALEGFVGQTQYPVERYERAYYQCLFQIIPALSGETSVRVTAKITAWYGDPDKQKSGYEILPSNGRLENDALDRVEEILEGPGASTTKSEPPPATKYNLSIGPAMPRGSVIGKNSGAAAAESRPPAGAPTSTPVTEAEIQDLRTKRVAAEKRVQQLNNALQNLQKLYDSQTMPNDVVAVKKTGTPVFARPEESGKPLFAATAKDQFEMIELRGEWVHVQIAGESRGWIRKAQLEFPEDSPSPSAAVIPPTVGTKSPELFHVTREETGTFPGNWEPLRGKIVKIYSVQPVQLPTLETTPREKLFYVKELFLRAWKAYSAADATTAGVVVVFDSADGGLASATLGSLQQWQDGKIPEAAFWQSCSFDPLETFSATAKKQ